MASNDSSVEDAFTTIRIRRFDHDRLSNMRRPRESWWEVVRRLLDAHDLDKVNSVPKGDRKVNQIKSAFLDIQTKNNVNEVSIRAVETWLNCNTKDGMSLMKLANLLSKRPSFKMVRREHKRGTTETESFWTMPENMSGPYGKTATREGWVVDRGHCAKCDEFLQLNQDALCDTCYIESTRLV